MVQLLVEGGEPDRNLGRAVEWIGKAAGEGCQIALLPEVLDLGWTHPSAKNEAEPIPGPRSELLCGAAQKNAVYVCAGLTEKEGNKVFNTALLIDESGTIILKYRKINVLAVAQEFYAIGNHLSVVETPLGVIGVDICSDNYRDSPEIGSVLARMGAQLILSPSAWTSDYHYVENQDPYGEKWFAPYHKIAKYFNVVMVGCTSVGYIVGGPYEGKKNDRLFHRGQSGRIGDHGALQRICHRVGHKRHRTPLAARKRDRDWRDADAQGVITGHELSGLFKVRHRLHGPGSRL